MLGGVLFLSAKLIYKHPLFMKKNLCLLCTLLVLCATGAYAQRALLPMSSVSGAPWTATCRAAEPEGDWTATDYNDSGWQTVEGALSNCFFVPYTFGEWNGENSDRYLRRTFNVESLPAGHFYSFRVRHDDGCEAWLNGVKIYDTSNNLVLPIGFVNLDETAAAALHTGENVLAVKVHNVTGPAHIDFGLYDYGKQQPDNMAFDNYDNSWEEAEIYTDNVLNNRYCYHDGGSAFYCRRTLTNNPAGLYVVRATGFERVRLEDNQGFSTWKTDTTATCLVAGDTRVPLRNLHEGQLPNMNLWSDCWMTPSDNYATNSGNGNVMTMALGIYDNVALTWTNGGDITLGVEGKAVNESRWAGFDNFTIDYIDGNGIANYVATLTNLAAQPMETSAQTALSELLAKVNAAGNYESKGRALALGSEAIGNAERSARVYTELLSMISSLEAAIATPEGITPDALQQAQAHLVEAKAGAAKGQWDVVETREMTDKLRNDMTRTSYAYFDIQVNVPGAMGDSLLSKTENFADVQSLKLHGTLNQNDLNIIQQKLPNLRELDMEDVDIAVIPNRFMYRHGGLSRMVLPANVTTIGDEAFYETSSLKNIDFPATLKSINNNAFQNSGLTKVMLPEGLESVGTYSFHACQLLKEVSLPSTLKYIDYAAFYGCSKLRKVTFAEGLERIGGSVFQGCAIDSLLCPSTLKSIAGHAFTNCKQLVYIKFNEGLTDIESEVFSYCEALTEVTLPSTLIGGDIWPFYSCVNLRKVTCLSIEPPHICNYMLSGMDRNGLTLYVPALSLNTYKQTAGWWDFPTILPIDYLPESITVLGNIHLTLSEMSQDYKPVVSLINREDMFGSLTVNGEGTLSMKRFHYGVDPCRIGYNRRYDWFNTLVNNSHLRADSVETRVFLYNDHWTFMSFPYNVKPSHIKPIYEGNNQVAIYRYDGEQRATGQGGTSWKRLGEDDTMNAGEGYIIQTSRYADNSPKWDCGLLVGAENDAHKNDIFVATNVSRSLGEYPSEFAHNRGWNLIGNPYPSYYDTRYLSLSAPITIWNLYNNRYEAYSPVDDAYILFPGEAFFVQCPAGGAEETFDKEGRQTDRNVRPAPQGVAARVAADGNRQVINLVLTEQGSKENADRTRIVINEAASTAYETERDAAKWRGETNVPLLYSTANGVDYAINERPLGDGTVHLALHATADGEYTIALDGEAESIYLEDVAAQRTIDLTATSYTFFAKSGDTGNRFILHIGADPNGIDTINGTADNESKPVYDLDGIRRNKATAPKGIYIEGDKKTVIR